MLIRLGMSARVCQDKEVLINQTRTILKFIKNQILLSFSFHKVYYFRSVCFVSKTIILYFNVNLHVNFLFALSNNQYIFI